jgi:hypothetical protein
MIYQTINTRCLIEAAKRLNLPYKIFDENGNLVEVKSNGKKLFFANYSTPFNPDSFCKIAKDKEFTHFILGEAVRMPKAIGFFDPDYDEGGEIVSGPNTYKNIASGISRQFGFPVVIKPNSLSRGRNFFVCGSEVEILAALKKIFEKTQNYDYVALAQEYIKPKNEYRTVIFKNEIMLVYTVKNEIKDEAIKNEIREFIQPIFDVLDIGFAGLDIIESVDGKKYLLELNAEPGFANFVSKNGPEPIVEMYCRTLKHEA